MANAVLELRVSVAWWVRPYLAGVELCAELSGLEPDWEKVLARVMAGVRVHVGKAGRK